MKSMLKSIRATAARLHRDEGGSEGLEKLLIIAAVSLPLLGLLIFFRKEINTWVNDVWGRVKGEGQQQEVTP